MPCKIVSLIRREGLPAGVEEIEPEIMVGELRSGTANAENRLQRSIVLASGPNRVAPRPFARRTLSLDRFHQPSIQLGDAFSAVFGDVAALRVRL